MGLGRVNCISHLPTATSLGSIYSDTQQKHANHIPQYKSKHFGFLIPHGINLPSHPWVFENSCVLPINSTFSLN